MMEVAICIQRMMVDILVARRETSPEVKDDTSSDSETESEASISSSADSDGEMEPD